MSESEVAAASNARKIEPDPCKKLKWGAERSVRYHMRRQGFFERWHQFNAFMTLMSGSAGFALIALGAGTGPAMLLTAVVAVISALDLLGAPSTRARLHHDLRRRFTELLIAANECDGSAKKVTRLDGVRKRIENDEPPVFRALDILAHNDLCAARGIDPSKPNAFYSLPTYMRLTAQIVRWDSAGAMMKMKHVRVAEPAATSPSTPA
jgi:hypothetical protein